MTVRPAADRTTSPNNTAAAPPVLVFERRGQTYCCPTSDVLEIVEDPVLDPPGYPTPLVVAVLLHNGGFIPAVDPANLFDHPPERRGDVVLLHGPAGTVGLLADRVLGFRQPSAFGPAPWIPSGRMCRSAAVIDGIGRAFVLAADGVADVPSAATVVASATVAVLGGRPGSGESERAEADDGPMHLIFSVGGRAYAAGYADVHRILYRHRLFRVPGAWGRVRCAVEVIGAVVPVLDLAEPDPLPERADFVVLSSSVGLLALRVDAILRPLPLRRDPTEPEWFPAPGIAGIGRQREQAYSIITGEALLRDLVGADARTGATA
ncbi:chemotaxis protein CheW [Azospirillum griseum]|uniref:Chemotaxis protein CheW n=1 Tax=Azospirillum griseum TaxID=2496639 RepID=A0A431VC74_9PROT|nr:chemotaxis protein CheW [Azospirillum griseum]RTR16278.1 chemotaxis protein CheW [Azospirillum griseum]